MHDSRTYTVAIAAELDGLFLGMGTAQHEPGGEFSVRVEELLRDGFYRIAWNSHPVWRTYLVHDSDDPLLLWATVTPPWADDA